MTARDSVILPINYIIWRKSGPVLTGPTGPAPTPLHDVYTCTLLIQVSHLFVPIASISSMKTIDGACSSATLNNSLTNLGPSP